MQQPQAPHKKRANKTDFPAMVLRSRRKVVAPAVEVRASGDERNAAGQNEQAVSVTGDLWILSTLLFH